MNPQCIQQQSQQKPGYFSGPPTSSAYGEVNSNVPTNMLKGSSMNSETYATQKPLQGPPLNNSHQPQVPYYMKNVQTQGDTQYESSTNSEPTLPNQPPHNNTFMQGAHGQQNLSGASLPKQNLSGPPLPSQQSLSGPQHSGPPLPGQHYPPLQGQQKPSHGYPEQPNTTMSNLSGPSTSSAYGEVNSNVPTNMLKGSSMNSETYATQKPLQGPPLNNSHQPQVPYYMKNAQTQGNTQYESSTNSEPTLPNQPPHNNTFMQGAHGQQNLSGASLPKQNLSGPPLPSQQSLSGPQLSRPPLPGQHYPPLQGQQKPSHGYPEQPNTTMSNLSGPPLRNQQNMHLPPMPASQGILPPPLTNQQSYNRSPMVGQQNIGSQMPPPLPGQPIGQINSGTNLQQYGQEQYAPIQGQNMSTPLGINRSAMSNYQHAGYQQGYNNDMYNAQRGTYQGGPRGITSGYQQGTQPQQARRLDPEQMPSPIQVIQDDQQFRGGTFITNQKGLVPPLVTTNFITQDQGNASPRYIRSTMYTVPTTSDIIKQTNVPFGLILSPMARIVEGEREPPIVDMGEIGPVRCVRCKAYMSPFMQFIDAGRRFQCMFCKATTEVPSEYFQHLDHTGQRMDRYQRPELMLGTYEYIATIDYCTNNTFPKPPAIVFVIDVSYNTVKSGLINLLCMKMKSILRHLPVDAGQSKTNMKVGFITYNNTVHFYNINSCLAQPQMMVVGDVQDVFMPLLDGFLCDVEESESVIDGLMTQIPAMFADTRETETILAPAIQAGLEALKASDCAGKLIVFHSSLPIAEAPGKLKNRDDRKVLGTEKEKSVLAPQNNVYNNLGQDCVDAGCSVDLFVFNNSYVDIATIGQVARLTGGEVYKYTYFQADIDGDRLIMDVINNISRPIAFDAIMRVRTSTGVRATDFYGHFFMSNTTDMKLASIDCNKAVAIEIKHDDKLAEDDGVYIQAALLYTSCSGIRRLRIINLSLKTSSQLAELYRACDLDAIINYFSKQNVSKLIESTPKTIKDNLISGCANMLAAYRKHCATPSNDGQLILPECMKLLPLYINSLLRSDALSGGADMTIDDRSFVMQAVTTMPIAISVVYVYPRLLSLHDVDVQDTELPQMLRCSIDKFTDDGAYLLENSIHMFLWLGLALSPQWVQAVFGVPSVVQVDTDSTALPVLDTPLNKRITDIINRVRTERHRCMRLTIVRQREKLEMVLRHFLVEDRGNDGSPSYIDFLCHMHKEIRTLLSQ